MTPAELDAHVTRYQTETESIDGFSSRDIADWLNAQGIRATASSVGHLLARVRFTDPQGRVVRKYFPIRKRKGKRKAHA